ncbi:hypothetical protein LTR64_005068 [Lithohypha guttulata]|uniref:uncharacterized protein n=1 Tax=Lithohypha guttulata TaxID=1690604 RepID=UPI002DDF4E51|nr:hypothetical protein LTR51_005097 [Lithohypha guttulata]
MAIIDGWRPSLIVGIDFGMTCTAVSFSQEPEYPGPWQIQKWPRPIGTNPGQLDNKVTTAVGYDGNNVLVNWGFVTGADGTAVTPEREFKLYIDPSFPDDHPTRPSHAEAIQFYTDYMTSLRQYIEVFFANTMSDFHQRNVEYLFSIPTTWKNPMITANLGRILSLAGFSNGYNRRLEIYLTEAEAAAVNAAKQTFRVGDIVMVADAGGATTDINTLKLLERSTRSTKLKSLTKAEGINVGSTLIDEAVRRSIAVRLRTLGVAGDDGELHWIADDMMREKRFEGIKCGFLGEPWQVQLSNIFNIPLDVAPQVRDRRIIVTGTELKGFFDSQIAVMAAKIDQQRLELTRNQPGSTVGYLVLSGGLGSSAYVQRQLRARYPGLQILCASEPQLAVAKGLVMDRVQKLKEGVGVYTGKCSRVSYGVLCRQPYDKKIHNGEFVEVDPLDKQRWAIEQIDWLIREGEAVPETGFTRRYQMKLPKNPEKKSFEAQFVMSEAPSHDLPRSLRRGNLTRLCNVRATFRDNEPVCHPEERAALWSPITLYCRL